MQKLAVVCLTILGLSSNLFAAPTYQEIVNTQKSFSVKTLEVDLNSNNCSLKETLTYEDVDREAAWAFLCHTDLSAAAKPLLEDGYEFGDVRYRDAGGNFKSGNISTQAIGWAFEFDKMPTVVMVKKSSVSSTEEARVVAHRLVNDGSLKLRMSFTKRTCLRNGEDVSNSRIYCRDQ